MKHTLPEKRDPFRMQEKALDEGWQTVESIPLRGEGEFMVLTMSGLIRKARQVRTHPRIKRADGYGPARVTVVGVETGNYLAAIAWRWDLDKF